MENFLQLLFQNIKNAISPFFSRVLIAIIIFLFGLILGRFLGKLINTFLEEIELNKLFKKLTGTNFNLSHAISIILSYLVYLISALMAIDQLGIINTILYLIIAAFLLIIVFSIILGIRDFIPNLMAGLYVQQKHFIKEGDEIEINNIKGKITKLDLMQTTIETKGGDTFFLPNILFTKTKVRKIK